MSTIATKRLINISVIGSHDLTPQVDHVAHEVGKFIAEMGCVLVCGGLEGSMTASARGAKVAGGQTVGLLPGNDHAQANEYIDIAIPTTIGFARNACVAAAGDIVVALSGSHGTRSEISYALVYGRPVIDLGNWNIEGMISVADIEEAKQKIRGLIQTMREK